LPEVITGLLQLDRVFVEPEDAFGGALPNFDVWPEHGCTFAGLSSFEMSIG